jgi:hypothetical protein
MNANVSMVAKENYMKSILIGVTSQRITVLYHVIMEYAKVVSSTTLAFVLKVSLTNFVVSACNRLDPRDFAI